MEEQERKYERERKRTKCALCETNQSGVILLEQHARAKFAFGGPVLDHISHNADTVQTDI